MDEDRPQPVTRLVGSGAAVPSTTWFSSDRSVATVTSTTGFLSAQSPCGGTTVVRARATTSTVDATQGFVEPPDAAADGDANGNDDANDTACLATDPLCDQVNVCVPRAAQIPLGTTCEDPAPAC